MMSPASRFSSGLMIVLCSVLLGGRGWAQVTPIDAVDDGVRVKAVRLENAPALDGNVVSDPAWAGIPAAEGFVQIMPEEGRPASERTEVRLAYTDDALYIGVVCYDRNPSALVITESRRDSTLEETDSFQVILDTFRDGQNGFVFGTTPASVEYDGQVTNGGDGSGRFSGAAGASRAGGQQAGSGGGFNLNWDGSWQVRARITELGWEAEFVIPFRTFRYPAARSQTWGVNFQRNIGRRKETSFWAPLPRQFNLYRVSEAGQLVGLEVPPQRNLKFTPYALGEAIRSATASHTRTRKEIGADLKYSLTPSMTLDVTYNTDFAQVEVDEQQINLDRFNLFFPEKRPFFLENAGLFSVGAPGQTEMFFSRRIGIDESGEQIPILAGARMQGKVGSTSIGLLNMQSEAVEALERPGNNFSVARVRQDFRNRSNVGAMFVNRQGTGHFAPDEDWNRTYAVDGRLGIRQNGLISGYAARTQTPGTSGQDHAYSLGASYDAPVWRYGVGFTEVSESFNPEVGFLQRRGFRRVDGRIFTTFRPAAFLGIQEIRPHSNHFTYWSFDGRVETQYTHIDNHFEWRNGIELHTGMNLTTEGVFEPFEITSNVMVPAATYEHREAQLVLRSGQRHRVSFEARTVIGGFFGGDRVQMQHTVDIRAADNFTVALAWERNDVDLPGGDFTANLARTRVSYSFTPRMFVQALVQYNDRANLWSSNLRLGLISEANTGLFVVYNDTQGLNGLVPPGGGRSLAVKYSYLMDLLQ